MTDTQAAESSTVDTQAAAEAAVLSQDTERDFETEARAMGWVPEEEFKGDKKPARFKSAKEFVEDGEAMSPHVKRLLAAQEKVFEDRIAKIERMNKRTADEVQKRHKQELANLTEARKKAVAEGDAEEVARISDEIAEKKATKADGEEDDEDLDAATEKFAERNPWYGDDPILTNSAETISRKLAADYYKKHGKQMPLDENFKQVEAKIKATPEYKSRYPDDKPAANGHAAVDGGSNEPPPSRNDPFAKLSSVERAKAVEDMKAYPKMYPTKESWLKAYNS